MVSGNNKIDYPQNLELTDWLKFSLTSDDEFARQIALEEMVANGINLSFLDIITDISEHDLSQNCRSQAKWLLKLNETKSSLKSIIKKLDVTPDFIKEQLQKGEHSIVNLISQMLRKAPSSETISLWRTTVEQSSEVQLIQVGLDILCKFGNDDDSELALRFIQNNNSQVVCSAFSLLAKKNKELFKKYIKYGLGSKSADVILHSLHLLRSIDELEAIKYLSVLLLNKKPLVRQKALREFMLVNFEKVENLLWQYLSKENQPFLLVKAGLLATFNPAQHFPFKIYDIMSVNTGVKQHILQLILKQTVTTASASGILKNKDINTYLKEIKQYISNKRIDQTIRMAASNLKSEDVAIRSYSVEKLSQYISHPKIKALLANQLKIEKDENIKSYLVSLFEDEYTDEVSNSTQKDNKEGNQNAFVAPSIETNSKSISVGKEVEKKEQNVSSESFSKLKELNQLNKKEEQLTSEQSEPQPLTSFPETKEFVELTSKEQRSLLKRINSLEEYHICKKTLLDAVDFNIKKTILLDILKLIEKYGKPEDAKAIYHLIKSQDYSIVAQAVKTIGVVDLDRILPVLNKFLAHDDPRVKSAVFTVYTLADKEAAVQYIGTMLKNTDDSVRSMGLSLIPQLDYSSAEPLLWWMLEHESNIEIQDQVAYMVAANPTSEGINKIYAFTHDSNGEIREGLSDLWKVALISAENVFGSPKEEIEKKCFDNLIAVNQQLVKDLTDYNFKSVIGELEEDDVDVEDDANNITKSNDNIFTKYLIHVYDFKYLYITGICVISVIIYFIVNNDNSDAPTIVKSKEVAAEAKFLPSETTNTTQVDSEDWTGGIKSAARSVLRSSRYTSVIQSVNEEVKDFREESERLEKEYLTRLANDSNANQEERDWAAAQINVNLQNGLKAFGSGNIEDAQYLLEKAADDPSLSSYGRLEAMQKLIEIADIKNDKDYWKKWMSRFIKETKKTGYFQGVKAYDDFDKTMENFKQVQYLIKNNSEIRSVFINDIKANNNYTDKQIQESLDSISTKKDFLDYIRDNNF